MNVEHACETLDVCYPWCRRKDRDCNAVGCEACLAGRDSHDHDHTKEEVATERNDESNEVVTETMPANEGGYDGGNI